MSNDLNTDKQIAIIAALAEGSSIRAVERMTGVHRDTIMRLGVRVGQGCSALMDFKLQNLPCTRLEMDEIWGFVGKKEKHVKEGEDGVGSVWTFCAIDADTRLVPAFRVGHRDAATPNAFLEDVADRMTGRVQISTDGLQLRQTAQHTPVHSGNGGWRHAYILERWGFGGGDGMAHLDDLKDVIRILHGVESTHRESVPVKEVFNGHTVWEGIVEVFTLHGPPKPILPTHGPTRRTPQRTPSGISPFCTFPLQSRR